MKGKKQLGLMLMTFAIALVMCFGVKLQAKAQLDKDAEFYNTGIGNGEAAQVVKYVVTKKSSAKSSEEAENKIGECKVVGVKNSASTIIIQAYPKDEDGYVYHTVGICNGAFRDNKKLKYVQINGGMGTKEIAANAFSGCSNLKKVVIQDSAINKIGEKAFFNCKKLATFEIYSKKLTKSGVKANAFKNVKKVKVLAPSSSVAKKYATYFKKRGAKTVTYGSLD
jgi:hypothetical protein